MPKHDSISRQWGPFHEECKVPLWKSCRLGLAILGFFTYVHVYMVRVNISVAIVCMSSPTISLQVAQPDVRNETLPCSNNTYNQSETFNASSWCNKSSLFTNANLTTDLEDASIRQREFAWGRELQGQILSSFFFGYLLTQLLGGWLAGALGSKHVLGTGLLLAGVSTLFVPMLARAHYGYLIGQRVFIGMATGVAFPAGHALWGKWAPPLERSKLIAICYGGAAIGSVVITALSGVLCDYGFAGGWPSIFYVSGMSTIVSWVFWMFLAHSSPAKHPRISIEERHFIEKSIGTRKEHVRKIPWKAMMTSMPALAIFVCHFCASWGLFTMVVGGPMYLTDVLKVSMTQGGALAAMPPILGTVGAVVVAISVDHLRKKQFWSTGAARKWMQGIGTFPAAACLIAASFLDHNHKFAVMALMGLFGLLGSTRPSSYNVNHVDIAPRYAGVLYGISNTMGTTAGIIAPIVIGQLTPNQTREEWQIVFIITAVISSLGALFFIIFASGEEQEWAKDPKKTEPVASYSQANGDNRVSFAPCKETSV